MKKVSFDTPVTFYIKESEEHRLARQSTWLRDRADKQRFMDRIKAVGAMLLPVLRNGKNSK